MTEILDTVPITIFKINPANPRSIDKQELDDLCSSLKQFPEMLVKRPIVIRSWDDPTPIAGNQRLEALRMLGYEVIPKRYIQTAEGWTEQQIQEFIIRDNTHAGTWNITALKQNWNEDHLKSWGLNLPKTVEFTITGTKEHKVKHMVIVDVADEHEANNLIDQLKGMGYTGKKARE